MSKKNRKENEVTMKEYLDAQMELEKLQKEHGIQPKEKGLSRFISSFFERRDAREKVLVNRKKFLLLALFTGWMGGHRFYSRRYILGTFYLLLCWTGVPLAMTIIDLMEYLPVPADEDGNFLI